MKKCPYIKEIPNTKKAINILKKLNKYLKKQNNKYYAEVHTFSNKTIIISIKKEICIGSTVIEHVYRLKKPYFIGYLKLKRIYKEDMKC